MCFRTSTRAHVRGVITLPEVYRLVEVATQEILPDKEKSRATIQVWAAHCAHKQKCLQIFAEGPLQREIRAKERAIDAIVAKHTSHTISEEDIRLCLYSICDNNSFLNRL
jgi:hypothetical protein